MIAWETVTAGDADLISKIAKRYTAEYSPHRREMLDVVMDITAVHINYGLRLADLLTADSANFLHDVYGIRMNLNRTTGMLENCWYPRYSDR